MTLGEKQREFTYHVSQLIQHIYAMGYTCTFGDAFRDPRTHGVQGEDKAYGEPTSAHKNRLAVDLNLFLDNSFIRSTEPHRQFGTYWKALHRDNVWGGDFDDGNHYSRRHDNVA